MQGPGMLDGTPQATERSGTAPERASSRTGSEDDRAADLATSLARLKSDPTFDPRELFANLRRSRPIPVVGDTALVMRFRDVQEVLSRDEVFQVPYRSRTEVVTGGQNFLLGMQNSPEYERDLAHMRCAIRRDDLARIGSIVQRIAADLVREAGRTIDVVQALFRVVPSHLVEEYFGCPAPTDGRPSDWAAAAFRFLFVDPDRDPVVERAAREAAAYLCSWLDLCIAERKARPSPRDDVLGRCLALQHSGLPGMDDLAIRANLLGMIVGALPTISKCCAHALDELLRRPEHLDRARRAAVADDDALLAAHVFEALRFRPHHPGLIRIAAQDYQLARGTSDSVAIPKGMVVFAVTQSAMFDETAVDQPDEFRVDRPPHVYMHFGYGLHTCFGQHLSRVQVPGILKALLRCHSIRRAPGEAGALRYDGPYPASMQLVLE